MNEFLIAIVVFAIIAYFIHKLEKKGKARNVVGDSQKPIILVAGDSEVCASYREMGEWAVRLSDKESHSLLDTMEYTEIANDFITYFIVVALQTAIYRFHVVKVLGFGDHALHEMKIGERDSINTFTMGDGEKLPDELCSNFSIFVDFFFDAIHDDLSSARDRVGVFGHSKLSATFDAMLNKYNKKYVAIDALDRMLIGQVLDTALMAKMEVMNSTIRQR